LRCLKGSVKDIYFWGKHPIRLEMPFGKPSRKGLSPLLAIIIGLVVTIVAGILLAQLYFNYAAAISSRPAANIEYVDAVETPGSGTVDILAINIKNTGNVPIIKIKVDSTALVKNSYEIDLTQSPLQPVPPGATYGFTCDINDAYTAGSVISGSVTVMFSDGSAQSYAFSVRMRG